MSIDKTDSFKLNKINDKLDANGYLRVTGYAARVGVLKYDTGNEYVPPETLFDNNSLQTMIGAPVSIDHHDFESFNGDGNVVGSVVAAGQQDGKLRVDMVIYNDRAIEAIRGGKTELSCGYKAEVSDGEGMVDGLHYDKIQTARYYNHLAIVDFGRAGAECSIKLDNGKVMKIEDLKKENEELQAKVDSLTKELSKREDQAASIADLSSKLDKAGKAADELRADLDVAKTELEGKIDSKDVASILEVIEAAKVIGHEAALIKEDGTLVSADDVMRAAIKKTDSEVSAEALKGYFEATIDFAKEKMAKEAIGVKSDSAKDKKYVSARDRFIG